MVVVAGRAWGGREGRQRTSSSMDLASASLSFLCSSMSPSTTRIDALRGFGFGLG